jgi:hypothetical protein
MGNIRVIGPKGSGKTTYLAALAYQPLRAMKEYQNLKVQAVNDDTRNLADKAENIISQGASVEPTSSEVTNIYDLPSYSFNIELKRRFRKQQEQINLVARDYPGEIFEDLEFGSSNPLHQEFIEECLTADVNGCLILLTHWQSGTDSSYSRIVQRFIELMDKYERTSNLRLAIAMSKCERGELWPGRLDPHTDLFNVHLPRTTHILQQNIPAQNLGFYAISTFGVLGRKDPRPNRTQEWGTDGKLAVLRDAKKWRPYNLVAPLYWLSTGRKLGNDA